MKIEVKAEVNHNHRKEKITNKARVHVLSSCQLVQ